MLGNSNLFGNPNAVGGTSPNFDEEPASSNVSGISTFAVSTAATKDLSEITAKVAGSQLLGQTSSISMPASTNASAFEATPYSDVKPATSNVCNESAFGVSTVATKNLSEATTEVTGSGLFENTSSIFGTPASTNTSVLEDEKPAPTIVSGGSTFKFSFADTKCLSKPTTEVTRSELIKQTPSFTFGTSASANIFSSGDEKPATTNVSGGSTLKFSFADSLFKPTTEVTGSELTFGATKGATSNVCGESTSGVFSLNTGSLSNPATQFKFSQPSHVQMCSQKSPIQAFGSGLFGPTSASTGSFAFGENNTGRRKFNRFYRNAVNDLKTLKESVSFVEASVQTQSEFCTEKLSVDLSELLLSGDCSDFTIEVKGVEFQLHRGILSARSPVFQSMFKHNMMEKETGRVSADDCEVDTFRAFVQYLYAGRTDQLNTDIVFGLFALADKYQVDELKSACIAFIKSNLLVETFCDTVQFALKYDNRELLEQAIDFLAVKPLEVMKTVKWMNFLEANHIQANELLLKALDRKQH